MGALLDDRPVGDLELFRRMTFLYQQKFAQTDYGT
jgi:hypothetical protein